MTKPITRAELVERIRKELQAMPAHAGKNIELFVTGSADRKWTVAVHGDYKGTVDAQALYDAQPIAERLKSEFHLVDG